MIILQDTCAHTHTLCGKGECENHFYRQLMTYSTSHRERDMLEVFDISHAYLTQYFVETT